MKTFYKALVLGLLVTVLTAISVSTVVGQDEFEKKKALYEEFVNNYDKNTLKNAEIAVAAGEKFVAKYTDADSKPFADFIKGELPGLKKWIVDEKKRLAAEKIRLEEQRLFNRFDASFKASNWDEVYSVGGQILAKKPEFLDVVLALGSIGLDESQKTPSNTKYNDLTISYAKKAISMMNKGVKSQVNDGYGVYQYTYKTKEYPDGKNNALGWMHYTIGIILFDSKNQKEAAIPHLYKATKYNSSRKKVARIYGIIGDAYFNKLNELSKIRLGLDQEAEGWKEKDAEMLAVEKGYADRAIDAYSRAYGLVRNNPKAEDYKKGIYSRLKAIYDWRYDDPEKKNDNKINLNTTSIMSKPMPDPKSKVTPVKEEKPAENDADSTVDKAKTTGMKTSTTRSRTVKTKKGN